MLSADFIAKYTNGNIINGDQNIVFDEFLLTPNLINKKSYLYIPINFKGIDREKYILDHVKNGCLGFFIAKNSENKKLIVKEAKKLKPNICIIEVNSVNQALYDLGLICREQNISKPVIAVTGSVGKTTLCNLISEILETEKRVLHDFKNENNNTKSHISLSYLYFEKYDIAVTELGISNIGIMNKLSKLTKPSIAIINNIGTAHLNKLQNKETIFKEKLHITDYLCDKKILFLNEDDKLLKKVKIIDNGFIKTYSIKEAKIIAQNNDGIEFRVQIYNKDTYFKLKLFGDFNIRNIVLAIKIAEIYNIKYENIVRAINSITPIDGRLNVIKNYDRNIIIIDDSYSSSFESLEYGLMQANMMKSKRKIAVLGKMAAYGDQANNMHEKVGDLFSKLDFDYLYLTGDNTKHIFKNALNSFPEKNIRRFKAKEDLIDSLIKNINDNDLIYIKAANTQNFKIIVDKLKEHFLDNNKKIH